MTFPPFWWLLLVGGVAAVFGWIVIDCVAHWRKTSPTDVIVHSPYAYFMVAGVLYVLGWMVVVFVITGGHLNLGDIIDQGLKAHRARRK